MKKKGRAVMSANARAWGLGLWLAATAAACGQTNTTESGETHFLLTCSSQTCGEGLECLCGACSRPCTDDQACDGLGKSITCVEHDATQCKTVTKSCDVVCEGDADCGPLGKNHRCRGGFCRSGDSVSPPDNAGAQACASGCGNSECATPGACSLAAACQLVDCGGVNVDEQACVRPSCESDDSCSSDERCTAVYLARQYDCSESAGNCNCTAGLGLYPLRVCSPVALVGVRGSWTSLELEQGGIERDVKAFYPDGHVEITHDDRFTGESSTRSAQLSAEDRDELTRIVDGPDLRLALADPAGCESDIVDDGAAVKLDLGNLALEKVISGCRSDPPFLGLLELAGRY